jgi:hypothetical protein
MAKIIQVTNYPILSANSVQFLKELVKDNDGEWKLITATDPCDAKFYGDEAELLLTALQYKTIYHEDAIFSDGTTPLRPSLSIIDYV